MSGMRSLGALTAHGDTHTEREVGSVCAVFWREVHTHTHAFLSVFPEIRT